MNMIKRAIQMAALGACAVAATPAANAALAEGESGFYLGIGVGKSSYDLEKAEFDDIVSDAFFSQGAIILSGSSTFESKDNSLALFAGYRMYPYLAFEAGYLDLGTAEYRFNGTINPPGPVTSSPGSLSMDIESKGFTLTGLGNIPIGQYVDLHGRLGFFIANTDLTVAAAVNSSASQTESFDSQGVLYGVGAGFHIGKHFSLSVDWTRYDNVADEEEEDDSEGGFDIDAISLSAIVRF